MKFTTVGMVLFSVMAFSEIDFSGLIYDYSWLPQLLHYQARDHAVLDYRYYPSSSKDLLIVIHGSGYHSRYLYKLAKTMSDNGVVQVITPDLRGHGINPRKRGDIDYIGQLDDDLDDFVQFCRTTYHPDRLFIAGHSSGGGLALRLMGNQKRQQADGYILLAPYLAHDAATTNAQSGWAKASLIKVIVAHMLNGFGLHWLDHAVTIRFTMPKRYRDGSETLAYTHALITSMSPIDYQNDFRNTTKKTLIVVGENDEAMHAHAYENSLPKNGHIEVAIVPHLNHMGIVIDDSATRVISGWLKRHIL